MRVPVYRQLRCGPQGNFCGSQCTSAADCPEGYFCIKGTDVEGSATHQCALAPEAVCDCSIWLSAKGDKVATVGQRRSLQGARIATLRVGKPGAAQLKGYKYATLGPMQVHRSFRALAPDKPGHVRVVGNINGAGHEVVIQVDTGKEVALGGKVDAPMGSGGSLNGIRKMSDGTWLQVGGEFLRRLHRDLDAAHRRQRGDQVQVATRPTPKGAMGCLTAVGW